MGPRLGLIEGKVALVTGAASGIGRATAQLFAREGATGVMIVDVDEGGAHHTKKTIIDEGFIADVLIGDISAPGFADAMVKATVERFGRLDCAHNNVGVAGPPKPMGEYGDSEFEAVVRINVYGTFACMRSELAAMVPAGSGAIVNTASATARLAVPGHAAYSGSKAAVIGMTAAAAREYAETGVRINAVSPGGVATARGKAAAVRQYGSEEDACLDYPLRRLAEPMEVAQAVVWLCSDRASYVHGENLLVDGGFYSAHQRRPQEKVIQPRALVLPRLVKEA
jgi:NAD(P)-dependent dehydrogenase (short-subunit alcohol dehydrogenase family)